MDHALAKRAPEGVKGLAERIAQDRLRRESCWTESLAVGSREFVERMQPRITSRRQTETVATGAQTWALREEPSPYDQETSPKIAANGKRGTLIPRNPLSSCSFIR